MSWPASSTEATSPTRRRWRERIKDRIRNNIGEHITCSIGFAANRLLAKIACKVDKPNGVTIWHPDDMPAAAVRACRSKTFPASATRMEERLKRASIRTIGDLWNSQPKHLRALWGNVNGERMWYALHGYDIHAMPTSRGMFGHGRVLPPDWRDAEHALVLLAPSADQSRAAHAA